MFTAFYAAIYDRIFSGAERAGLSEERRGLLAHAAGIRSNQITEDCGKISRKCR